MLFVNYVYLLQTFKVAILLNVDIIFYTYNDIFRCSFSEKISLNYCIIPTNVYK